MFALPSSAARAPVPRPIVAPDELVIASDSPSISVAPPDETLTNDKVPEPLVSII